MRQPKHSPRTWRRGVSARERDEKLHLRVAGYHSAPFRQQEEAERLAREQAEVERQRQLHLAQAHEARRRQIRERSERWRREEAERKERNRVRALENEVVQHRQQVLRQQHRAMLDAEMRRRAPVIAAMERLLNPAPEPEVIYDSDED
jgi:hypothetical protein